MSVPLPGGYVDTGHPLTLTASGTFQGRTGINSRSNVVGINNFNILVFADGVDPDGSTDGLANLDGFLKVDLRTLDGTHRVEEVAFTDAAVDATFWSAVYTYNGTCGPYRVGVLERTIGGATPSPLFKQVHTELVYALFADENTALIESCGGYTTTRYADPGGSFEATSPITGMTPIGTSLPFYLSFGVESELGVDPNALFSGLSFNGAFDTSGLDDGVVKGDGGGAAHAYNGGSGGGQALAGFTFSEDIDISKFGGATTGATVRDADGNAHTVPYSGSGGNAAVYSWLPPPTVSGTRYFSIDATWAAAHHFRSDDLNVPLMQAPRALAGGAYHPASIYVESFLDVLRPPDDAFPPSGGGAFVSSDTSKITVADTWSNHFATISVAASGAQVARSLISRWRDRVGLGMGGVTNAVFGYGEYAHTKHKAGEDIYEWSTYRFLRVNLTAPADVALSLQLDGNYLDITDNFQTSGRDTGYSATLTAFTYQYTIPVTAGTHDYYIDLSFPTNVSAPGLPVYPSRIDTITLSGFVAGTVMSPNVYTLNKLQPEARGNSHFKLDFGPPVQRGDYSVVMAALDGSYALGNLPDQAYKPDEVGAHGGGLRYINILTGFPSDTIQDSQLSLSGFLDGLNNIEGFVASYDATAGDSFLGDGTNRFSELAQNIRPIVPFRTDGPGIPWGPDCSCQCRQVVLCPGIHVTVFSRWNAGFSGIEALEKSGSGPAPAGKPIIIGGTTTGAVTDAFGWGVWTPVSADGTLIYSDGVTTLTPGPHDLVRLLANVPAPGNAPWVLAPRRGGIHVAYGRSGDIKYVTCQRDGPLALGSEISVTGGTVDSEPAMADGQQRGIGGRIVLLFTRNAADVYETHSDGDGESGTWSTPTLMFSGCKHPDLIYDPGSRTWFYLAWEIATGHLKGARMGPGDAAPGAAFTLVDGSSSALVADDDCARVAPAGDGPRRWRLAYTASGVYTVWKSTDDGTSWVQEV